MISGERIKQAREIAGLTQAGLADKIGVNQSNIARLEQGFYEPIETVLQAVALATGFPVSFFREAPAVDFHAGSLLYRKRASLRSIHRSSVRQLGAVLFELTMRLARRCGQVPLRIAGSSGDPVSSAERTRDALGIPPDEPLPNVIRAVEKAGVVVIAIKTEIDEYDAFSSWSRSENSVPVIILGGGKTGDRLRFNVAHELAHLILHKSVSIAARVHEREADEFASEILFPSRQAAVELVPPLNLSKLAEIKGRWGISIQAILMKALRIGVVTPRQYKYLMQQITVRGWRKHEPVEIPLEKPRLLRQLIEKTYGVPLPIRRIAQENDVPERLIEEIVATHAGKPTTADRSDAKVIRFKAR